MHLTFPQCPLYHSNEMSFLIEPNYLDHAFSKCAIKSHFFDSLTESEKFPSIEKKSCGCVWLSREDAISGMTLDC